MHCLKKKGLVKKIKRKQIIKNLSIWLAYSGVPNCRIPTPILSDTIFPTTWSLLGTTRFLIFDKNFESWLLLGLAEILETYT